MRRFRSATWLLISLLCLTYASRIGMANDAHRSCLDIARSEPLQSLMLANTRLEQAPQDNAARHCRAMALFALGQYDPAADEMNTLLTSYDPAAQPEQYGAFLMQLLHATERARRTHQLPELLKDGLAHATAHDLSALKISLLEFRTRLFMHQRNWYGALQDADHLLSLNPDHLNARLMRARTYDKLGFHDLALNDFRHILKLDPNHTEALLAIGKP